MTWARLDDLFPQHPKIVGLSDAAFRLHVTAICYAAQYRTDGYIPESVARQLAQGKGSKLAIELVGAHVWDPTSGGGFAIHDYLIYNTSRSESEAKAKSRAKAGAIGAARRWHGTADAPEPEPDPEPIKKERSEAAAEVSRNGAAPPAASPAAAASASPGPPDGFIDCVGAYDDLIGQPAVTPHIGRKIEAYLTGFHGSYPAQGVEWFRDACIEAATHNKRSLSYVTAILERWQREGRSGKRQRGETTASTLEEQRRKREYTRGSA